MCPSIPTVIQSAVDNVFGCANSGRRAVPSICLWQYACAVRNVLLCHLLFDNNILALVLSADGSRLTVTVLLVALFGAAAKFSSALSRTRLACFVSQIRVAGEPNAASGPAKCEHIWMRAASSPIWRVARKSVGRCVANVEFNGRFGSESGWNAEVYCLVAEQPPVRCRRLHNKIKIIKCIHI